MCAGVIVAQCMAWNGRHAMQVLVLRGWLLVVLSCVPHGPPLVGVCRRKRGRTPLSRPKRPWRSWRKPTKCLKTFRRGEFRRASCQGAARWQAVEISIDTVRLGSGMAAVEPLCAAGDDMVICSKGSGRSFISIQFIRCFCCWSATSRAAGCGCCALSGRRTWHY